MSTRVHPSSSTANPILQPNNIYRQIRIIRDPLYCGIFIAICYVIGDTIYDFYLYSSETPNDPTFDIDSLTLSNLNISSNPNQISANWNVSVSLTNIDKHGYFYFSAMTFAVYYYDIQIGVTGFQPIYINPVSPVMQFAKEFSGSSGYVNDSTISMIRKDIVDAAGTVKYNVQFQSMVEKAYEKGGRIDNLWAPYPWIVVCENVELDFGSSLDKSQSQMLSSSYKCKSSGYLRYY